MTSTVPLHDNTTMNRVTGHTPSWISGLLPPVLLIALSLLAIPGFTGDDSFIHFTYARNLLERGVIGYNTAAHTYGSTSLLWVFLCAAGSLVVRDLPLTGILLSGLFFLGSAILFTRYLSIKLGLSGFELLCGTILYCANAVLFRWVLSGMETMMVLFLLTVILNFWHEGHPVRLALLTLVGVLARPEFLLLPVAYGVVTFRRTFREASLKPYWVITLVLLGAWTLLTYSYFGSIFPLTAVKTGSGFTRSTLGGFVAIVGGMYPEMIILLVVLIFTRRIGRDFYRALPAVEKVLVVFSCGVFAGYLISGTTVISRYVLLVHPILILIVVRTFLDPALKRRFPVLAAGVLTAQLILFVGLHYGAVRSNIEGFQKTYSALGEQIVRSDDADTGAVMLVDVGIAAYYSRRPVIDLLGLTSRHMYEAGTRDDGIILSRYRPRYAVVRIENPNIDSCTARWKSMAADLASVTELRHDRIGPLGILAGRADSFDVYLVGLDYRK